MARKSESDLAITALAVEAERRRKQKGLIRYNYGNLVADTTPEERQRIIEDYKSGRRRRDPAAAAPYKEPDDRAAIKKVTKQK